MNIRFAVSGENIDTVNTLQGYYWNKDDQEWIESVSIFEEDYIVVQTRHASAVGIFDTDILATVSEEEVPPDEEVVEVDEETVDFDLVRIVGIIAVVLLLIGLVILLRKRQQKRFDQNK